MAEKIVSKEARTFGQRLKSFREAAGVTQQDIADATGFTRTYISALERGVHKCNAETFMIYSRKCGVSLDKLAGFEKDDILPELKEKLKKMDMEKQKKVLAMIELIM